MWPITRFGLSYTWGQKLHLYFEPSYHCLEEVLMLVLALFDVADVALDGKTDSMSDSGSGSGSAS